MGPRGPFLQSGVEVVPQLAHRRALLASAAPWWLLPLLQLGTGGASGQGSAPDGAGGSRGAPAASARRVDDVPSESVQSTEPP